MKKLLTTIAIAAATAGCATTQPKPDVVQLVRENEGHPEVQRAIMEKYLAEKAAGEARLRNMALISGAAMQAGAAWNAAYQAQQPRYVYTGPSPAATYFYGMQQARETRQFNNDISSIKNDLRAIRFGY